MNNQDYTSVTWLIEHVRQRSSLWDIQKQSIPGIKKRQQRLWTDVAMLHNSSVEAIKKQWANLRNAFTKQLNKVPKKNNNQFEYEPHLLQTNWPHYQAMLFLVNPRMMPSQKIENEKRSLPTIATKRRLNENNDDDNSSDVQANDDVTMDTKRRRLNEDAGPSHNPQLIQGSTSISNDVRSEEVVVTPEFMNNYDSDVQWLMSFYEFIRPLAVVDKLRIRSAVTNVFTQIFNDISI